MYMTKENTLGQNQAPHSHYPNSLPLVRWWWFSGKIEQDVIAYQLKWVKDNHFGGTEIAFVYPLPGSEKGPEFLSEGWTDAVNFAKEYSNQLGLSCDFTFGSLWPFCGSFIAEEDRSKQWQGLSDQKVTHTWESAYTPHPVTVLDHLDKNALRRYSDKMGTALKAALNDGKSAVFCDSWEVETEGLWRKDFERLFLEKFGYDILPHMGHLDDEQPRARDIRYDYRALIGELAINEFYKPFTNIAHELNAFSRVQCHGAPCDVLAAYATADVPESEAILFDPEFSVIAASAAALTNKTDVSCEAFTCLYGWVPRPGPAPYIKRELVTDLKLLADALFANGVNQMFWHGMPYNPPGGDNEFYATVHVGEKGSLAPHYKDFNRYMGNISAAMKEGTTFSQGAVYLPLEDARMAGMLPEPLRKPSALHVWEFQHESIPEALNGYRPLWVTHEFLKSASVKDERLLMGDQEFLFLYIYSDYVDYVSLKRILSLAREGLPVCIRKELQEPGLLKHIDFPDLALELISLTNVSHTLAEVCTVRPFIEGSDIPEFWCRKTRTGYSVFLANPQAKNLTYPLKYGYSLEGGDRVIPLKFNLPYGSMERTLTFRHNQSILLNISENGIEEVDVKYGEKDESNNQA